MKVPLLLGFAAVCAIGATPMAISASHLLTSYSAPAQCRAWYDGCNFCEKNQKGETTCTTRICNEYGRGFCKAYFPPHLQSAHS